jgi:eukaryotic-like serine/threonine-protein kinase
MTAINRTFTYEADDRLAEAIAAFEEARDAGSTPDPEEWMRRYPEVAAELADFFAGEQCLCEAAGPLTVPVDDLPAQVGRFHLEGQITHGGMARIVRVRDHDFERLLAMKIPLVRRADVERRFVREARMTGLLQHPGIPPVHALGRLDDGRPYFVMKLIHGSSLSELLKKRPSPAAELPRFVSIFEQMCQTVGYAHSRRVIHRDLKPANVMVGSYGEVQVLDWGLAKVLGADDGEAEETAGTMLGLWDTVATAEPTQRGCVMGTWPYMPPEMARGEIDSVDARSDVFGLGGILCEILTGQPPFTGTDAPSKAKRGDLAETEARLANCGADAELVEIARSCLALSPAARPADGAAVAAAVVAYQAELKAAAVAGGD